MSLSFVENNRVHSATGAFGGSISGATDASPVVLSFSAAHNLLSADPIVTQGIGGNSAANGFFYADVLTSTTLALYSDVNLSVPVSGSGAYTSGGSCSIGMNISQLSPATMSIKIEVKGLGSGQEALIALQSTTNGFSTVTDEVILDVMGGTNTGFYLPPNGFGYSVSTDLPALPVGIENASMRLGILELTSGASVTLSLSVLD